MSVGKICQREVDFAEPEESVFRVAERMRDRTVGALVVLNKSRQPIGILTDRDVALRVIAAGRNPIDTTVEDAMTRDAKTASEETPFDARSSMRSVDCLRPRHQPRPPPFELQVKKCSDRPYVGSQVSTVWRLPNVKCPREACNGG